MRKVKSAMTKRNSKARLMRAASFILIAPVTKLLARLFPNWRRGMASLTGILVLVLVGIFNAELTRSAADYLRDAIAAAGLTLCAIAPAFTRTEAGEPVPGLVVTASKA